MATGPPWRRGVRPTSGAFSLLEILVVVVILGILAALLIPRFASGFTRTKQNSCAENKAAINTLVEKWHFEKGQWPSATLDDIGADPAYFPSGIPACPVSRSKYTLDETTHRVSGHNHDSIEEVVAKPLTQTP